MVMDVAEIVCRYSVVLNISTDNDQASFRCKVVFNTLYKSLGYRSSVWKWRQEISLPEGQDMRQRCDEQVYSDWACSGFSVLATFG